jgi:alpha-beta hydrolase superfamily lysophospholipase
MEVRPLYKTLPPLSIQAADINSSFTKAYLSFYGLNFAFSEYHIGTINTGNTPVIAQIFRPLFSNATILLSHGLFDHSALFKHIINHFLGLNFTVVTFDYPGHGLSPGSLQMYDDFKVYSDSLNSVKDFCLQSLSQPLHLLGHSTGCSAIIELLRSRPSTVSGISSVIFLAPLIRPVFWHASQIAFRILRKKIRAVPRIYHSISSDKSFLAFYRKDPLQAAELSLNWVNALINWNKKLGNMTKTNKSILVIQGTSDNIVDWKHNLSVLKMLFKVKCSLISGSRHHPHNESYFFRQKALELMGEYLQSVKR